METKQLRGKNGRFVKVDPGTGTSDGIKAARKVRQNPELGRVVPRSRPPTEMSVGLGAAREQRRDDPERNGVPIEKVETLTEPLELVARDEYFVGDIHDPSFRQSLAYNPPPKRSFFRRLLSIGTRA